MAGPPPPDRWERRQFHLLADDLACTVAETAATALNASADRAAAAAVDSHLATRPAAVARYRALAEEVPAAGPLNLSLLALTVRAMADVGRGSAEGPGPGAG